ncbi:Malate dehydrogenase [Candidatus Arsenophonus lipoptenae]|uniref:Malate dehydrogenase n=1 Tax=Candidatus Arsenophonus lipoptenae TaxID=634113 RepID=A0A0X9W7B8_9GAMM|nr:malate dehydrogenase [Candidatus Arsenophonus lipoptenae]AMA65167.1 Malate dehydrogenase [Candidatus Arsenophonus lipoptenae]
MKVVILGAAGGVGQVLALLLKNQLPAGTDLSLYDISSVIIGIAKDLDHIPTDVNVIGYTSINYVSALQNANIVLIAAGITRQPNMNRSDLFNTNAIIIFNLIKKIAYNCPKALIGIITNPINAMVPLAAKVLKKNGVYNRDRLFGITTLDVIRSNIFVAKLKGKKAQDIEVVVIGGHSKMTILPLLSHIPDISFNLKEIEYLTSCIQNAGTTIVEAKLGCGSATLSMGYAATRFCLSLIQGLYGKENVIECAYIESDIGYTSFFAHQISLGINGIKDRFPIGIISKFEKKLLENMLDELNKDIKLGEYFVENMI